MQISCNLHGQSFGISSTHFHTSLVQDHIVRYAKKHFKSFVALCYRNGSFEWVLMEKRPWDFRGYPWNFGLVTTEMILFGTK